MLYNFKLKKVITMCLAYILMVSLIFGIYVHAAPVHNNPNNILIHYKIVSIPDPAGSSEIAYRQPYYKLPYKNVVFYIAHTDKKEVALTFDDGPDVTFTPKILDILKENNTKATFFVLGKRAKAHPEIVKRIVQEGHAIGNHSWDHPNLGKLSANEINSEIQRTDNILFYLLGYHPALVRPPYGAADLGVIREVGSMGYKIVQWSVDTRDWAGTPSSQIMLNVRKRLHPGAIILLHCAGVQGVNLSNTTTALPQIIKELKAQGYEFVTIPELLHISPSL